MAKLESTNRRYRRIYQTYTRVMDQFGENKMYIPKELLYSKVADIWELHPGTIKRIITTIDRKSPQKNLSL